MVISSFRSLQIILVYFLIQITVIDNTDLKNICLGLPIYLGSEYVVAFAI